MKRPAWRLALLALILVAFALRVVRLDAQELRGDEAFGYFFTLRPYADIVAATLALHEPHPVASYFLQKTWMNWTGDSEFALRFVSVWWGVVAIALLWRLARRLALGPPTALLGAGLLALSPYVIEPSQTARMYSISLALTLASSWLALEALARGRWRYWGAYVAVSWLALHTHYYAIFILVAQNLFVALAAWRDGAMRRKLGRWLTAQAGLWGLYLPWLIVARSTLTGYGGAGDSPAFAPMLRRALSAFLAGDAIRASEQTPLAVIGGALALIGVLRLAMRGGRGRQTLLLLLLYGGLPVIATWLSAQSRPIFNERYLVAAAPAYYLLLAIGLTPGSATGETTPAPRSRRRLGEMAAAVSLLILLLGAGVLLGRYYAGPNPNQTAGWRQLAAALSQFTAGQPPEHVRLVQNYPDPALWYYYRGPVSHLVLPPAPHDERRTDAEVLSLRAAGVGRVVLIVDEKPTWDDERLASAILTQHYPLIAEQTIRHWPIQIYDRPDGAWSPIQIAFGEIRLTAVNLPQTTVGPGGVLAVHLRWQADAADRARAVKATVQLLTPDGRMAAQMDRLLTAAELIGDFASYGLPVPADAPPGNYHLIVAVYDPAQPGAPRLLTATGADHAALGGVIIEKPTS